MLPTRDMLKQYWCVVQEDYPEDLPCALFILEKDALDWIAAQEEPFPDEPYVAKQMGE